MRVARPIPFAGAAFAVLHRTREFILKVYASLSLYLRMASREEIICMRASGKTLQVFLSTN